MSYNKEIEEAFGRAYTLIATVNERHDDATALSVQLAALLKATEDSFLVISRQIEELSGSLTDE